MCGNCRDGSFQVGENFKSRENTHGDLDSSLDDPSAGARDLQRLSQARVGTDPSVKGLNFFNPTEQALLRTLQRGEFNIHGWRRADSLARLNVTPFALPPYPRTTPWTRRSVAGL